MNEKIWLSSPHLTGEEQKYVREAFETDVRPLLAQVREEMGLDPDPMTAYMASGHEEAKKERGYGQGWS